MYALVHFVSLLSSHYLLAFVDTCSKMEMHHHLKVLELLYAVLCNRVECLLYAPFIWLVGVLFSFFAILIS
jgi:uncharacterized membrane protein YgdD (TMEM256/DUF423 family)